MFIHTEHVKIPNGDLQLDAYWATPIPTEAAPGPYPGIIVLQEVFGVNTHIRAVTDRLAQMGYQAIAPALYQRTAPGFEVGYSPEELALGRSYKEQTTAAQLLSDIQATIDWLKAHTPVTDRFGAIGFCFGGHVAYLAATLPAIAATASFYGAGIATMTPGGGPPTLSLTPNIRGTLYGFFGLADPLIPQEHVDQIEVTLQAAGIRHEIFRYPDAGHGFCCDQRADYCPEVAATAWEKVKQLFETLVVG